MHWCAVVIFWRQIQHLVCVFHDFLPGAREVKRGRSWKQQQDRSERESEDQPSTSRECRGYSSFSVCLIRDWSLVRVWDWEKWREKVCSWPGKNQPVRQPECPGQPSVCDWSFVCQSKTFLRCVAEQLFCQSKTKRHWKRWCGVWLISCLSE